MSNLTFLPRKREDFTLLTSVNVVLVVVTLVGVVPSFFNAGFATWSGERKILYLAGTACYLIMGIAGWQWLVEGRRRFGQFIYFVVQIGLVYALQWLSFPVSNTGWILMMPVAGQSINLPRWGTLLVAFSLVASFAWTITRFVALANAYSAILTISAAMLFTLMFTYVAVREEKARQEVERLAQELQEANQLLREYSVQVEELAITKERNRLAREIHDSLGHYLTVINVQLQAAQTLLANDLPRARTALEKSQKLAQEGLQEVRRSVAALRGSPVEQRPLPKIIDDLLAEQRAAGMVAELTVYGEARPLDAPMALTLYRVAQEGLTNVRKHARASRVDVTLDFRPETAVALTIHDNGIGAADIQGGFGLLGLKERINLLQGEMRIETAVRQGFTLHVTLPVSEKHA